MTLTWRTGVRNSFSLPSFKCLFFSGGGWVYASSLWTVAKERFWCLCLPRVGADRMGELATLGLADKGMRRVDMLREAKAAAEGW